MQNLANILTSASPSGTLIHGWPIANSCGAKDLRAFLFLQTGPTKYRIRIRYLHLGFLNFTHSPVIR